MFVEVVLNFDLIAGSSQVITMREKEDVSAKANCRRKLTPGTLLTFLQAYSSHNRLLERPLYVAFVISTILDTLTGYSFFF